MKACILSDWEKLETREIPIPEPHEEQTLIKMKYAGVCGSDISVYSHHHLTATIPRILCHEMLGYVERIDSRRNLDYGVGDRVLVDPLRSCGTCGACRDGNFHVCKNLQIMGLHIDGGFAEYVVADADAVFPVPEDMPDRAAILSEPFAVGVHANMRAGTKPGDVVLIVGAGPIGVMAGICAKWFGAAEVYISEVKEGRRALAQRFGLRAIDPMQEDPVAVVNRATNGEGCDVVLEASGSKAGGSILADACKIRGTVVLIGVPAQPVTYQSNKIVLKEINVLGMRVYTRKDFQNAIRMLYESDKRGEYDFKQLIDETYRLSETERAIIRQKSGENNGKLIVEIGGDDCDS